ncbi:MAG TPA: hypothetical protein VG099_18995 [Gemmataceae bacterium]|jgi:hypothetical protein|nr:hypothetical protein [Gemmataceae bacterium]
MEYTWIWVAITVVAVTAIYFVWGRKLGSSANAAQTHDGRQ